MSRDDVIKQTAEDILEKIPPVLEADKLKENKSENISPVTVVFMQEVHRFNRLTTHMDNSLKLLKKVCQFVITFLINKFFYKNRRFLEWVMFYTNIVLFILLR